MAIQTRGGDGAQYAFKHGHAAEHGIQLMHRAPRRPKTTALTCGQDYHDGQSGLGFYANHTGLRPDRQIAHALAGCREDGVAQRGGDGRHWWLAHAAWGHSMVVVHQMRADRARRGCMAHHFIVMEIALLDSAFFEADFS